jgi:hypothetical protein
MRLSMGRAQPLAARRARAVTVRVNAVVQKPVTSTGNTAAWERMRLIKVRHTRRRVLSSQPTPASPAHTSSQL